MATAAPPAEAAIKASAMVAMKAAAIRAAWTVSQEVADML